MNALPLKTGCHVLFFYAPTRERAKGREMAGDQWRLPDTAHLLAFADFMTFPVGIKYRKHEKKISILI
jgi:hypothetical protein